MSNKRWLRVVKDPEEKKVLDIVKDAEQHLITLNILINKIQGQRLEGNFRVKNFDNLATEVLQTIADLREIKDKVKKL